MSCGRDESPAFGFLATAGRLRLANNWAVPQSRRAYGDASRPIKLRYAHAVEMAHERVPPVVIQRQLGHANLGITSIYLQGIDSSEIIHTVHSRTAPVIPATAGLESML